MLLVFLSACQPTTPPQNSASPTAEDNVEAGATNNTATAKEDISFAIAKNYFVKHSMSPLDNPKIETAEQFQSIFGAATTMGEAGKPTDIDFSKQYVIAVVLPETNLNTTIEAVRLQKNEHNEIDFYYHIQKGEPQTYTIKPALAIVVDKKADGKVNLYAQ